MKKKIQSNSNCEHDSKKLHDYKYVHIVSRLQWTRTWIRRIRSVWPFCFFPFCSNSLFTGSCAYEYDVFISSFCFMQNANVKSSMSITYENWRSFSLIETIMVYTHASYPFQHLTSMTSMTVVGNESISERSGGHTQSETYWTYSVLRQTTDKTMWLVWVSTIVGWTEKVSIQRRYRLFAS